MVFVIASDSRGGGRSVAISPFPIQNEIASVVSLPRNDFATQSPKGVNERLEVYLK
jgi:hypothetical protein